MPATLRNPLYHWTHLELKRYFGIDELLDEAQRPASLGAGQCRCWPRDELSAHGILEQVPRQGGLHHRRSRPTIWPGTERSPLRALGDQGLPDLPAGQGAQRARAGIVQSLGGPAGGGRPTRTSPRFDDFLDALRKRHDFFHEMGGRLRDHGLNHAYGDFPTEHEAAAIFGRARGGHAATREEHCTLRVPHDADLRPPGRGEGLDQAAAPGRAPQQQYAARFQEMGPDTGWDSIGDWPQGDAMGAYLDRLDQENALPKIVIYNLNPADNYVMATMIGNFQDGITPGKIQFGSGWWFLDQKEAMQWQMNALSNCGLLSRFLGMLTDSRSFMSYPRHEYFRRVLCDMFGRDIENGEMPDNDELVGPVVRDICYGNAHRFLGLNVE